VPSGGRAVRGAARRWGFGVLVVDDEPDPACPAAGRDVVLEARFLVAEARLARAGDDGSPARLVPDVGDVAAEVKPVQLQATVGVIQAGPAQAHSLKENETCTRPTLSQLLYLISVSLRPNTSMGYRSH